MIDDPRELTEDLVPNGGNGVEITVWNALRTAWRGTCLQPKNIQIVEEALTALGDPERVKLMSDRFRSGLWAVFTLFRGKAFAETAVTEKVHELVEAVRSALRGNSGKPAIQL
jgi:hypothetical protein